MAMNKAIVAVVILFLISSQMESVESSAADCLDACSTACVQRDTRLMQRCERKCEIKCGPDSSAQKHWG